MITKVPANMPMVSQAVLSLKKILFSEQLNIFIIKQGKKYYEDYIIQYNSSP
jgi:hypothetical protein